MRVLVAGSTGFLGRAAVRALVAGGHDVRGLVHSPGTQDVLANLGASAVHGDLLRPDSLRTAVQGCDLVLQLAQSNSDSLAERHRVRVDGTRHLLAAMSTAGVRRLLVGSGYWVYDDNPGVITEGSPLAPVSISQINFECEEVARAAAAAGSVEVVVARPGMVYGDGSWFREMVKGLRQGTHRYIGPGSNFLSPIHVDDAGAAFRTLAERWPSGETFLVVDNEPVRTRAFVDGVANLLGVEAPTSMPEAEAAREWGVDLARLNTASRRASNARLRSVGWYPRYPSWLDGVPEVLKRIVH